MVFCTICFIVVDVEINGEVTFESQSAVCSIGDTLSLCCRLTNNSGCQHFKIHFQNKLKKRTNKIDLVLSGTLRQCASEISILVVRQAQTSKIFAKILRKLNPTNKAIIVDLPIKIFYGN